MKINDVEKLLGITKANIRFYEKEGLLMPGRSENGYREYSESDISRLKEIVIYRKLGIPVQQIEDILDGALPLQEAVTANITALNEEIEKLNGSLALCKQLQAEDARTLDTERYWEIIQDNERHGMKFQSLISDYLHFLEPVWEDHFWFLTEVDFRKPLKVFLRFLLAGILWSLYSVYILHGNFWSSLGIFFLVEFCLFVIYIIGYIPIYRIGKKDPERAQQILTNVNIGIVFFGVVLFFLLILLYGSQLL